MSEFPSILHGNSLLPTLVSSVLIQKLTRQQTDFLGTTCDKCFCYFGFFGVFLLPMNELFIFIDTLPKSKCSQATGLSSWKSEEISVLH